MRASRSYWFTSPSPSSSTLSPSPHPPQLDSSTPADDRDAAIAMAQGNISSKGKRSNSTGKRVGTEAAARTRRRQSWAPKTPAAPLKTTTQPVAVPAQPLSPERKQNAHRNALSMPARRGSNRRSRNVSVHDPDALPPAVAALLAVTTIPRPKPNQFRRRSSVQRRISVEELVREWKADDALNASLSSNAALNLLLENADDDESPEADERGSYIEDDYLQTRSTSAESVPSLEADDKSILSLGSLSTPESLRSRRSCGNLRKEKARCSPVTEDCEFDHPLAEGGEDEHPEDFVLSRTDTDKSTSIKPRSSFKSNLTASLQALKSAAINSIATLTSTTNNSTTTPSLTRRSSAPPFSDDLLWSHPFLFPRLAPETRPPKMDGPLSDAQRRYFNPPLNFEEQEAPYQQALHAPFLAEHRDADYHPPILMQTYSSRGSNGRRRPSSNGTRSSGPISEAGRAQLSAADSAVGVRLREPRENSDFLRVIVLEMNMRREGKLDTGRARIWLPPRAATAPAFVGGADVSRDNGGAAGSSGVRRIVPRRWEGISAY